MRTKKEDKKAAQMLADAEKLRQEEEAQTEHRRKLLASLDPKTREMARRDFAKLGLYQ